MAQTIQATPTSSRPAGRRSLLFGLLLALAVTMILHWLFWAFMDDFLYALLPAFLLGGVLFGSWWFMAHRVKVEAREGRLH